MAASRLLGAAVPEINGFVGDIPQRRRGARARLAHGAHGNGAAVVAAGHEVVTRIARYRARDRQARVEK